MATFRECFFGQLVYAIKLPEEVIYTDWHSDHLFHPGLILIYESNRHPGKYYAYLFPSAPHEEYQPYLRTSLGDMSRDDSSVTITTAHSLYQFTPGDFDLTPLEKKELILFSQQHFDQMPK